MITFKKYYDITEEIKNLRYEVFVNEQNVDIDIELENDEDKYIHLCLYQNNILIAYSRLKINDKILHIGRVLVKKEFRGQGYGRTIMKYSEETGRELGCNVAKLNAQKHAIGLYVKCGYEKYGDFFVEANISHIKMKKDI